MYSSLVGEVQIPWNPHSVLDYQFILNFILNVAVKFFRSLLSLGLFFPTINCWIR